MSEVSLFLLPGLDGTGRLFSPLLDVLPSYINPSVISYPAEMFLDYPELQHYVEKKISTDKPFVILAESFSGPVALEYAAGRPPNLKALILCATFISNPSAIHIPWAAFFLRSLFRFTPPRFVVRRFMLGRDAPADLVDKFLDSIRRVSPRVLSQRLCSVFNVDAREALRHCRTPILYLLAKGDRLVGERGIKVMVLIKPEIEVVDIDGPHFLLQREPVKAVEAIDAFLRKQSLDRYCKLAT